MHILMEYLYGRIYSRSMKICFYISAELSKEIKLFFPRLYKFNNSPRVEKIDQVIFLLRTLLA